MDQACLKTIVELLAQLPLQPNETTQDLSQDKSKMFYKYFSFFIRLLNRCRILEVNTVLKVVKEIIWIRFLILTKNVHNVYMLLGD